MEKYTLPLAELLLEKMQIVQINEKDLIDTIILLREHPVGDRDEETVNAALIAKILGNDWGFWRTVTGNLKILEDRLDQYQALSAEDGQVVRKRIQQLQEMIEAAPKSLKWKARARIGEKMKWYKSVEELER